MCSSVTVFLKNNISGENKIKFFQERYVSVCMFVCLSVCLSLTLGVLWIKYYVTSALRNLFLRILENLTPWEVLKNENVVRRLGIFSTYTRCYCGRRDCYQVVKCSANREVRNCRGNRCASIACKRKTGRKEFWKRKYEQEGNEKSWLFFCNSTKKVMR